MGIVKRKIVKIEKCGVKETVDLFTPKYHNFILDNGIITHNSPIILDPAPEYYTSIEPVQTEFADKLLPEEEPRGFPIKLYYPYFLYKFIGLDLPGQNLFQLNISDINPSDLTAFINYSELNIKTRIEIDRLIAQLVNEGKKFPTFDDLYDWVKTSIESDSIKKTIFNSLRRLEDLEVFGDKYSPITVLEDLKQKRIIDINLFGWRRLDYKRFVALYVAILLRELMVMQEKRLVRPFPHLLLIFEEVHELAPRKTNKTTIITKTEIDKIAQMGRKYNTSAIFITQSPETISPTIIDQCNYVFVSRTMDFFKLRELIKNISVKYYDTPWEFSATVRDMLSRVPKYGWLLIERGGDVRIIKRIYGPLSKHRTEGI